MVLEWAGSWQGIYHRRRAGELRGGGRGGPTRLARGPTLVAVTFLLARVYGTPVSYKGKWYLLLVITDQYQVAINNLIVWCGIIKWHPIATSCIYYPVTDVVVIGKEGFHCRKTVVRRVPRSLPSATLRALGKQSICQVPTKKHSARIDTRQGCLPSA